MMIIIIINLYQQRIMKGIIILACAIACALALSAPTAPIWPPTFSQDFVYSDSKVKIHEVGKLWFDDSHSRIRIDYSGSNYVDICFALGQEKNDACTLIGIKGAMYVNLPHKSKCCTCCVEGDGCFTVPRNWMSNFTYAGEAILSGQSFYKWKSGDMAYYDTEDVKRIPRRVDQGTLIEDMIMNTFSTEQIADSVFKVPSNCNAFCPKGLGCRSQTQNPQLEKLRRF